ncbi:ferrochelatase [Capnocytophaga genosp. AHN8471]|jgi:ferrochelatase|uniref:Ferrochelatase n=1 Tax=Capnocytophaga genosp. AHN8471 TaxID=327574 RepID=A0ABS1YV75_9FLAO|nr:MULTISPECIES: ferrochelatase [Capnocytophaga]EKY12014.1 ferrochelatase [Capnocytophaga sp. oral taxon 326 str. F0382]MBM0650320.1 ferrochelatase [Capnocytophaga genosp. AHN8471]MBM0662284.1 ferrochelatase [Capnocytophaga genosp. AHN8471]
MSKKGVLLVNVGSPDSPAVKDIKRYLREFLMDERIIDLPYLLRYTLVNGIILNTRPPKTSKAYQKIWWNEGSPLIVITKRLTEKIQQQVSVPVVMAMRYGNPNIASGLQQLYDQGVDEVLLMPLYPQYAMATTQTIEVFAQQLVKKQFPKMKLIKFPAFFHRSEYIEALAEVTRKYLENNPCDHLLFSYHGVPERHLRKTSPTPAHKNIVENTSCCNPYSEEGKYCYRSHCFETTRLLAQKLELKENTYSQSFQSRLGNDKWITPFTADKIAQLAQQGVKKLAVITPAFVTDCVETLEEIEMAGGKTFRENGGEEFKMVPCLNDSDLWVQALVTWIRNN